MAYLLDGVDDKLVVGVAPVGATPLTLAAWFKHEAAITGDDLIVHLAPLDQGANAGWWLSLRAASIPANAAVAGARVSSNVNGDSVTAPYTADTWQHLAGVYTSNVERYGYLDGGSKTQNLLTRNVAAPAEVAIGCVTSEAAGFFDGLIGEVAIWDAALSDAEVADLAAGANPLLVRPADLVAYWPLRDNAEDAVGAADLTVTGATLDADHPPVDLPPGGGTVAGGTATEADTVNAGAVRKTAAGGTALEAEQVLAGAVARGIAGGTVAEASTVQAGTPRKHAAGFTVVEIDTVPAGGVPQVRPGGTAVEADTVLAGAPRRAVAGGVAVEAEAVLAGVASKRAAGGVVAEADTVVAGQARGTVGPLRRRHLDDGESDPLSVGRRRILNV